MKTTRLVHWFNICALSFLASAAMAVLALSLPEETTTITSAKPTKLASQVHRHHAARSFGCNSTSVHLLAQLASE